MICKAIAFHDERPNGDKRRIARLCSKSSVEDMRRVIDLMRGDTAGKSAEYYDEYMRSFDLAEKQLDEIEKENLCLKINDLAVNGDDLKRAGLKGKEIGRTLGRLLDEVIDGKIKNEKSELLLSAAKDI